MAEDAFKDLLARLVRVPKAAIDDKEREYQESKGEPAKPREIVTDSLAKRKKAV
jgi:hypothetical protein